MIRILHVEDDADIREIAKLSLEISGEFDITQCSSGRDALLAVETLTPDVFLLDVMMPDMTGPETLQQIRTRPALEETPAIFMTARAQDAELRELRALGAVDVISKPFDPMSLADRIKAVLG